MKSEKDRIEGEDIFETLYQAAFREEIMREANKRVENVEFKEVFKEIKRDDEMAAIVKAILPQHLRNTLLSGTVCS
jgi:hypothetical protein